MEYEDHGYKFEIGDPLVLDSVSLTSSDMGLMYPNSNLTVQYTAPDGSFQTANPRSLCLQVDGKTFLLKLLWMYIKGV